MLGESASSPKSLSAADLGRVEQLAKHICDDSIFNFLIGDDPAGLFTQRVNEFS